MLLNKFPKPFIVAEVGMAHDGSALFAHSYIDELSKIGVDAIKFQTHIAEFESSKKDSFRVKNKFISDPTRFDYWKRTEFSREIWLDLYTHCAEKNIKFLSSPFSIEAFELLHNLGLDTWKIGSGEIHNLPMLEKILESCPEEIIISSGLCNQQELKKTIDMIAKSNTNLTLLHCVSQYPTLPENSDLKGFLALKDKYSSKFKVGLSDHSGDIYIPISAYSLGAQMIEVHVTFDKRIKTFDSDSSLALDQLKELKTGLDNIYSAMTVNNKSQNLDSMRSLFSKGICASRDIAKGEKINQSCLIFLKPFFGIPAKDYKKVIGKRAAVDIKAKEYIMEEDLID